MRRSGRGLRLRRRFALTSSALSTPLREISMHILLCACSKACVRVRRALFLRDHFEDEGGDEDEWGRNTGYGNATLGKRRKAPRPHGHGVTAVHCWGFGFVAPANEAACINHFPCFLRGKKATNKVRAARGWPGQRRAAIRSIWQ